MAILRTKVLERTEGKEKAMLNWDEEVFSHEEDFLLAGNESGEETMKKVWNSMNVDTECHSCQ